MVDPSLCLVLRHLMLESFELSEGFPLLRLEGGLPGCRPRLRIRGFSEYRGETSQRSLKEMRHAPFDCHRRLPSRPGHRVGKPVASDREIACVEASGGADLSCLAAQPSPDSLSRLPAGEAICLARGPRPSAGPHQAPSPSHVMSTVHDSQVSPGEVHTASYVAQGMLRAIQSKDGSITTSCP